MGGMCTEKIKHLSWLGTEKIICNYGVASLLKLARTKILFIVRLLKWIKYSSVQLYLFSFTLKK